MARRKHTHKYYKMPLNGAFVWACGLSDCSHYMPKHLEAAMREGKQSICWQCGHVFRLDIGSMSREKPICEDCSPDISNLINVIEKLGI